MAATILIAGHHFIPYSREVVAKIQGEIIRAEAVPEFVAVAAAE